MSVDYLLREKKVRPFLLFFLLCSLSLQGMAQEAGKKFAYQCQNERLSVVFEQLERLSGYYKLQFAYSDVEPYRVTVNLENVTLPQAVAKVIEGKPISYSVENQYVYVRKNQQTGGG